MAFFRGVVVLALLLGFWGFPLRAQTAELTLQWDYPADRVGDITGFEIERRLESPGVDFAPLPVTIAPAAEVQFVDQTLIPGQRYCWRVRAIAQPPGGAKIYSDYAESQAVPAERFVCGMSGPATVIPPSRLRLRAADLPPSGTFNLLPNGDMETGPWESGRFSGTSPVFEWSTVAHGGLRALRMSGSGYQYGSWLSAYVLTQPETLYALRLWAQLRDVKALTVWASWRDAADRQIALPLIASAMGTAPWAPLDGYTASPPTATGVRIHVRCEGTNPSCAIDDATLVKAP